MSDYRRMTNASGLYFFTVMTYRRQEILCNADIRAALRAAIESVREIAPFDIDAWVMLPDHLHCVWQLPEGDTNYARRWAMIKKLVSESCGAHYYHEEWVTDSKIRRNESTLWQRRYWEHCIRDDNDLNRHRDYIHYNPVKHGLVERVVDWPYSSFHHYLKQGLYDEAWANNARANEAEYDYGE